MIQLCSKLSIESKSSENISEALDMCRGCKWYYNCDTVLELNDLLKDLEFNTLEDTESEV